MSAMQMPVHRNGLKGSRDTRRGGIMREEFEARFTPEHGNTWACQIADIDGETYTGRGSHVSSALNDAHSKFNEAHGRDRMRKT